MTDSFVTRCPHCSTRLRVTHEQISAAAGVVRCGTCLQTFNAHEHLLEGGSETAAEMDDLLIHDDLDLHDLGLDDLNLDEELAQIEAQEQAFSKELLDLSQQIGGNVENSAAQADEAWAEALLREEEGLSPLSLLNDDEAPKEETLGIPYKKSREEKSAEPAIDWRTVTVEGDDAPEEPIVFSPPKPPVPKPVKIELKGFVEKEQDEQERLIEEPLPLQHQKTWQKPLLWSLLSLVATLMLVGQYVFFHFDSLASQGRYRPWLAGICSLTGCQVPGQVDLSQIRSSNLIVRSHPGFAGALIVDAILYNRAAFAQPFPLLELEFANLAGHPVALRRFTPEQYLAGEMQGQVQMPAQVPIHITLEIQDPGKEAENYRLSVLSFE